MMVATPMYSFVRQRDCLANNLFLLHQVKHDEAHQCSSRSISISTSGVFLTDRCENPVVCLHRNDVYKPLRMRFEDITKQYKIRCCKTIYPRKPRALYMHCYGHALNLACSQSKGQF